MADLSQAALVLTHKAREIRASLEPTAWVVCEQLGFEEGMFPVCEDASSRSLALPFFTEIREELSAGGRTGSFRYDYKSIVGNSRRMREVFAVLGRY